MAKKVLIVDDSYAARLMVKTFFDSKGWITLEADSGQSGYESLTENSPIDLVITDINMPWLSGLDMIDKIREQAAYQKLPICLLTTETSQAQVEKAKSLNVMAFLVKPASNEHLEAVLAELEGT